MKILLAPPPLCRAKPVTLLCHPAMVVSTLSHTFTQNLSHPFIQLWEQLCTDLNTLTVLCPCVLDEEGSGSKDMATETTSSEEEQDYAVASPYGAPGRLGVGGRGRPHSESPMDGRAMRRSSRGSFTRASLEDLLSIDPEAYQSSVWLGTEDGW